ncbi:hypothetical protein GOA61_16715 [Sinorhizobium meliloti]|nr:hypothetical protein [Sinorhizobium meliloti]MDW9879149.1 hypothetical protein [Sinorhizobium meliloti]
MSSIASCSCGRGDSLWSASPLIRRATATVALELLRGSLAAAGPGLPTKVTRLASLPLSAFCCRSWLFRKRMLLKFSFFWLQKCQIDFIAEQFGGGAFFSFHFHLKAV